MNVQSTSPNSRPPTKSGRTGGRALAEWGSLGISTLIILILAGYLLIEAFQGNEPFVPVHVQAQLGEVREVNGQFILPVRIANRGQETLHDLKIEMHYQPPDSPPATTDLLIDYLGERSEETVYFYFNQHPSTMNVDARAASYRVE